MTNDSLIAIRPLDDPAVHLLLKKIPLAADLSHSNRSFIEHLIGTWWILNKWKMPPWICRAGLLHSCYSTVFYPHALFDICERAVVRSIIGRQAEALAYRFCIIDRAQLWSLVAPISSLKGGLLVRRIDNSHRIFLSEATIRNLLLVESANLAEQSAAPDGLPTSWMSRLASWSRLLGRRRLPLPLHLRPMLTLAAERKALRKYHQVMSANLASVPALLCDTISLNPWAGEPRLLRALCALERGDREGALSDALQGHALLSAWSVPWDKRWKLGTWLNLSALILQRIIKPDPSVSVRLCFKSVREALVAASGDY